MSKKPFDDFEDDWAVEKRNKKDKPGKKHNQQKDDYSPSEKKTVYKPKQKVRFHGDDDEED